MTSFRWSHLALLSAAVMLTVSLETLPAGLLPAMSQDFQRPGSAIGNLVSVWGFAVILTSIPLVRLVGRWDRRLVTSVCLGLTGLLGIGTAIAPTYGVALLTRVLAGASHGVFWALVVVYAATLTPVRFLAGGIALVTGGSQLAAALVIPAAAGLVEHTGWRWVYAALAVLAVLLAVSVGVFLPSDRPAPRDPGAPPRPPWRDARLVAPFTIAVVALFFVFSHFVVYTYATVYFADGAGGVNPHLGLYLAIIGVMSILGLVISGPLANRWPKYGLPVYLLVFALGMVLIVPNIESLRVAGLALWGLMFGTIGPISQALALRFSPERLRPAISAAMVVTFNLGISLGSFTGGVLVDTAGAHVNPYVAAAALVFAALLAWWAGSRLQQAPGDAPAAAL